MRRTSLWFVGPECVEIREEQLDPPGEGQVGVQVQLSAISPGTEILFYRGQVPEELDLDGSIAPLKQCARFPFKYGYASVGRVAALGPGAAQDLLGRRVFCFHPHESAFLAYPEDLLLIPEDISDQDAVFLPNMETALNFCMDAAPLVGETAAVFGLGIVGLLTTAILAQFPLARLIGFDPIPGRRRLAADLGEGIACYDPFAVDAAELEGSIRQAGSPDGLDLIIECSGSPQALNQAIRLAGFESRIVIGSWYGKKPAVLELGGAFHRGRVRLLGSQVSTIAGSLSGRWSKARRLGEAWKQVRRIRPARWVTHRFPIAAAEEAYALLAENREDSVQVVLEYPS